MTHASRRSVGRPTTRRLAALLLSVLAASVACSDTPSPAITAERAVLQRELDNLSDYLDMDLGRLLVEGDLLIVVRETLVGEILEGALPLERDLPGGYRVRLSGGECTFRTGLALVELRGRASLVDRPGVYADVTLYAVLDVVGLVGDPPVLQARPRVLGIETRDVGVAGLSPPAERLVNELARRRLDDLQELLGTLELPISMESSVTLPAVDQEGVRIPELSLHLAAVVDQVLVTDHRLWILVDLDLGRATAEPIAGTGRREP